MTTTNTATDPSTVRPDNEQARSVLVVGGDRAGTPLPPQYREHIATWAGATPGNDIACDPRELATLPAAQYDAVYCSHALEHFYRHEVPQVLAGILHVLKPGGFVHLRVPDIHALMRTTLDRGLDVDAVLYKSGAGPVTVLDVLYGYAPLVARRGQEHHAHRTGFSRQSLANALFRAGFSISYSNQRDLEIRTVAFKGTPDPYACGMFNLTVSPSGTLQ